MIYICPRYFRCFVSFNCNDRFIPIANNPFLTRRKFRHEMSEVHFGRKAQEIWHKFSNVLVIIRGDIEQLVNFVEVLCFDVGKVCWDVAEV